MFIYINILCIFNQSIAFSERPIKPKYPLCFLVSFLPFTLPCLSIFRALDFDTLFLETALDPLDS